MSGHYLAGDTPPATTLARHGSRRLAAPTLRCDDAVRGLSTARGERLCAVASAGHDVWRAAFTHGPLWDWLFAQQAEG
jgi:hypothetical protein